MCGTRGQRWQNQNLIIHHDNALAHRSFKVSQFLAENNMTVVPHPSYSPDLAPCDFYSSPSWSFGWRVKDSTPLKRFKTNRSRYLTQFQKGTSRDASKHGRNAGTAVFMQKGSTLKVMEEFNIQGKQTSFYKYCPGTFGYTRVLWPDKCPGCKDTNVPQCYIIHTFCILSDIGLIHYHSEQSKKALSDISRYLII